MSTEEQTVVGGFVGDPTEAFNPPAMSSCCGDAPSTSAADSGASTCCGTTAEAAVSGGCCGEAAKAEAIASGTGCCG